MKLLKATVAPKVAEWGTLSDDPWTAPQQDALITQIIELSDTITPRVIESDGLSEEVTQAYLLDRTLDELNSWLTRVAATYGNFTNMTAGQYSQKNENYRLGLRSGTLQEIEDLPQLGKKLALDVGKYVSRNPVIDVDELVAVKGIGINTINEIRELIYLDQPVIGLTSPTLSQFLISPQMETWIPILNTTDLNFFLGDRNTMIRGLEAAPTSHFERMMSMLQTVYEQALRRYPAVRGVTGRTIASWDERRNKEGEVKNRLASGNGAILVNSEYVSFVKQQIDQATTSIYLMVFLGTTAAGNELQPGPLELVIALEEAALRGVDVRVILDQDDGGEPYKSLFINDNLVDRFRAGEVEVKFDRKDTLLHSKVLVLDGQKSVVGSHNWTFNSFNNTYELSVYFEQEEVATSYQDRFLELWDSLPAN